jgi:hypothetical protein
MESRGGERTRFVEGSENRWLGLSSLQVSRLEMDRDPFFSMSLTVNSGAG